MSTLFDGPMGAALVTLDAVFGEQFLFFPSAPPKDDAGRLDPNARPVASSRRPSMPFTGCFIDKGAILHAHGRSMADSTTRPVVAEQPMIDVDEIVFGEPAKEGDWIQRDATGELYAVTRWRRADLGRAWIHLAELRQPASPIR